MGEEGPVGSGGGIWGGEGGGGTPGQLSACMSVVLGPEQRGLATGDSRGGGDGEEDRGGEAQYGRHEKEAEKAHRSQNGGRGRQRRP